MKIAIIEPHKEYEITYTNINGAVISEKLEFQHYLEEDLLFKDKNGESRFIHIRELLDYKEITSEL